MKRIIIIIIAVFSFGLLTAQEDLVETTNRVAELDPSDNILDAFGMDLSEFDEEENETDFDDSFIVGNEEDLLGMFSSIVDAREDGLVAANIWDSFGVGRINKNNLIDGRVNVDNFIGELPGIGGKEVGMIGSEYSGKNNKSGYGRDTDMMDPTGGMNGNNSGYMGDGLGNSYKNGNRGTGNTGGTGNYGGGNGGYTGQMGSGSDSGFDGNGSSKANHGGSSNGGLDNDSATVWDSESTHNSHKHSGSGGFSSFTHHHSSVSNDKGYSSSTDKQSFTGENGTTTTRVVVTQTQSDGSSKTVATTTTTDEDGNSHTERTTTEKNSDGEVTDQETTESNDPEEDGDDSSCERPDDGSYDNRSSRPSSAEVGSAVWRAVVNNSLAGGRGDDRTGQSDRNEMSGDFSPMEVQNQKGYMEPKKRGGKVNINKVNNGALVNPGRKDL